VPPRLAPKLWAYCKASGATHTNVICNALEHFIQYQTERNLGIKEDYEQALDDWIQSARPRKSADNLRLIEPKKPRGRRRTTIQRLPTDPAKPTRNG